jgi:hypothetical protein
LLVSAIATAPRAISDPPADNYDTYRRQGFTIKANARLGADIEAVLRGVDGLLDDAISVLPPAHQRLAREVTIWVEPGTLETESPTSQPGRDAFYYPLSWDVLRLMHFASLGRPGGITVFAGGRLLEPHATSYYRWQPGWLLHEFAHALQDRILGLTNSLVKDAYQAAMNRKLYSDVENRTYESNGGYTTYRAPAYAGANAIEYFAELSVVYLGRSKCVFPYTREQLREYDPAGFALMESFWHSDSATAVNETGFPVKVYQVGTAGLRFKLFDLGVGEKRIFDGWKSQKLMAVDMLDDSEYMLDRPQTKNVWKLTQQVKK